MSDVLLLDTHSLFFRAHFALPPMNTWRGEPTGAIYGFSALFLKLLREERPRRLGFARDLPSATFRHRRYPAYKAGRPRMPDLLRPQWPRLGELIALLGAPSLSEPGFEADDVLATASHRLAAAGDEVKIVSGDRDLFQLISPLVKVLFVGGRGQKQEPLDVAAIEARYGVAPGQLPTVFALVGEGADNLVGVPGVGPRTAGKLVAKYQTAASLLADLENVTPPRLREALRAAAERVLMNEELARLSVDAPLGEGPLATPVTASGLLQLRPFFEELEFKSLIPRLDAIVATLSP